MPLIFSSIYFGLVGHQGDQIGGYKSFKITSIFCFITSITFVLPLTFDIFQNKIKLRIIYYSVILSIFISSLYSLSLILSNHKDSIYILPPSVVDLNIIEGMNEVNGINILDMGNFTNLWANYFLLKKPHIFQAFPYSGRVVGAPIYPYTLLSNTTKLVPSSVSNSIFKSAHLEGQINIKKRINEVFQVADSTAGGGIVLTPGIGWWGAEPAHNWSGKDGRVAEVILDIQNPIFITISADFAGLREGENIVLKLDNEPIDISLSKTSFHSKSLKVERGRHTISMISSLDPAGPFPHDGRTLGILWTLFSVEQVLPPEN